jgi:hypothetical protein
MINQFKRDEDDQPAEERQKGSTSSREMTEHRRLIIN